MRKKGFTCAHLVLSKAKKEKSFIYGTLENTIPENAFACLNCRISMLRLNDSTL